VGCWQHWRINSTLPQILKGLAVSWNVALYIEGAPSLNALAAEVSILSGLSFERTIEENCATYRYSERDFTLILGEDHGMENDRDLNFEDYTYDINLRRHNVGDREQAQANTLKFAKNLFAKLKDAGRYRLMLVENCQKKLDSFG
jgi:hypothetical protein